MILLIGDGMGDSEITLARYYGKGAEGTLNMEKLPFAGELITYGLSAGPGPDYPPNYVPDSAPTATAWSTGRKTIDARLSQGPSAAENIPGSNGGFKTTFEIADKRGMRLQTLDSSTKTVVEYAQSKGYRYVQTAAELGAVGSLAKGPVLGLFTPGNMTTEFKPLIVAPTPGAGGPGFRCDETNRPANEPSLAAMTETLIGR